MTIYPTDYRPYPFSNIYDLRWYHSIKQGRGYVLRRLSAVQPSWKNSWNRREFLAELARQLLKDRKTDIRNWKKRKNLSFNVLQQEEESVQQDN